MTTCIREQDPLKQGLKHILKNAFDKYDGDSRARSTKTRIETSVDNYQGTEEDWIREQDPLKQGLKLYVHVSDPHTQ